MRQNGHEVAGLFMFFDDIVHLAVDAAVNRMHQTVAFAAAWMLKESRGEDSFAFGSKCDIDGVIHPARHHGFDTAALGTTAKNVRRACLESRFAGPIIG